MSTNSRFDKMDTDIMSLESLKLTYDNKLKDYEGLYANYIASLQASPDNGPNYIATQGMTFWGSGGLAEGPATYEQCTAYCSTVGTCTGMTYNPDKGYCWARSGEGQLAPGLGSDSAVLSKTNYDLMRLKYSNAELTSLNDQLMLQMSTVSGAVSTEQNSAISQQLIQNNNMLKEEKLKLTILGDQNTTIHYDVSDTSLKVESANAWMKLWMYATIGILLVLICYGLNLPIVIPLVGYFCLLVLLTNVYLFIILATAGLIFGLLYT